MARSAEMDRRLRDWAVWIGTGRPANDAARQTERAIASLPEVLQTTLRHVHLGHSNDPAWPESTLSRRIGRAHLLLAESLREHHEIDRRAAVGRRRQLET